MTSYSLFFDNGQEARFSNFDIIYSIMGRKGRNKFERLQSDDSSTSGEESSTEVSDTEYFHNENNSHNVSTVKGKNSNIGNEEKFLVTRSKRKYTKRQLPTNLGESSKSVKKVKLNDNQVDLNQQEPETQTVVDLSTLTNSRQETTVDDLNSKIAEANKYLLELQQKIKTREEEISELKQTISSDRSENNPPAPINVQGNANETVVIPIQTNESLTTCINSQRDECELINFSDVDEQKNADSDGTNKRRRLQNSTPECPEIQAKRGRSRSRSRGRDDNRSNTNEAVLQGNPTVQKLVEKMVSEQVAAELKRRSKLDTGLNKSPLINGKLKSPSESTLYTPAVRRASNRILEPYEPLTEAWLRQNRVVSPEHHDTLYADGKKVTHDERTNVERNIDQVSQFLNEIRFNSGEQSRVHRRDEPQPSTSAGLHPNQPSGQQASRARSAAETAILDAERFKAHVQQPPRGKETNFPEQVGNFRDPHFNYNLQTNPIKSNNPTSMCGWDRDRLRSLRYLDGEDDEFFHTTCHIDASLKEKIERGGFVALEKLIQRKTQLEPKDDRLQLINKDGVSYFVPSIDRETKIDNIRKWEQAFRVYTTIYCSANPTRSGEILQYTDVIHRAASTFSWDNVAKYDYVFRQLMAAKPHRSWAKVYTQMWNITLNEPLKKFQESHNYQGKTSQRKRESVCWKFNKTGCSFGKNCKFEHKCSYCGGYSHGASTCNKKQGKKSDKGKGGNNSSNKTE